MKALTIDNYLEAFLNSSGRFKTLKQIALLHDERNEPLYVSYPKNVDFAITHGGRTAAACCVRGRENPFELRESVRCRYVAAGAGEPEWLPGEVLVFDDTGASRWCNLWLVELPDTSVFSQKKPGRKAAAKPSGRSPSLFYAEGLAAVRREGKYGYVDRDGATTIPFRYDWADTFDEGLAVVKRGDLFGLIDKSGREVLEPLYEDIRWRSTNGVIPVCGENGAWRLYDRRGEVVSPNTFDFIFDFSCDLASVRREDKYGYIDRGGEVVIPLIYDEAYSFSDEGLATVVKNGISFMIDTEGCVFD